MAEEREKAAVSAEAQVLEQPSLLEEIIQATNLKPTDENYSVMRGGREAFLAGLLEPGREAVKVSKAVVDDMIAEIDKKMSLQLDAILHQQDFQKLESACRSMKFLIDKTDFRENVKVEILNVSKEDLLDDFGDAPEMVKSVLVKPSIQ